MKRREPGTIARFFKALGPGVTACAADDVPSGISYSIVVAQFGTAFLWMAWLTCCRDRADRVPGHQRPRDVFALSQAWLSVYRIQALRCIRNAPAAQAASYVLRRSYEIAVESGH